VFRLSNISNPGFKIFLLTGIIILITVRCSDVQPVEKVNNPELRKIIPAPENPDDWEAWRRMLIHARDSTKNAINYSDHHYRNSSFHWASGCYSVNMLMLFDRTFYDPDKNEFMVEEYVASTGQNFGGFDGVVLWHAYPRIGLDDRNQFDFYREVPGGLKGLKKVVERFHKLGVKVFINYNPWDTGTKRDDLSDLDNLVEILKSIEADGIFLDTLNELEDGFREKLDKIKPGIVLESELELPVERVFDHHMSWAQWFEDSPVPGVLWNKWFERRHMLHQIKRWDLSHLSEIHTAWMNGTGIMVWENVFGTMMKWNNYEKWMLRSILPVQRRYSPVFTGEGWTPLVPTLQKNVFASLWFDDDIRIWTIVNRDSIQHDGPMIQIPSSPDVRYFDLIKGVEINPGETGNIIEFSLDLPASVVGCILAVKDDDPGEGFHEFLRKQALNWSEFVSDTTTPLTEETVIQVTKAENKYEAQPDGMVLIDHFPDSIRTRYMMRECGFYKHNGYIPPPIFTHKILEFQKSLDLTPYAIDETPVTNSEYYDFIQATGYVPSNPTNFLKHWINNTPPPGKEDHPVVYVDLDDARAYAKWAGKRLPTEEEWQIAAQGFEGLSFPWGDDYDSLKCNHGQLNGTSNVKTFPGGRSPHGCYDMCGNTWEMTESIRNDGNTTYRILKGGSYFDAETSKWYTQGGPQPADMSVKFIHFYPGLDRCSTVGFRCVVDMDENNF